MNKLVHSNSDLDTPRLTPCKDPDLIIRILAQTFEDEPVSLFGPDLISAAARWIAKSDNIFILVPASTITLPVEGYIFCHLHGPEIWRRFALRHPMHWIAIVETLLLQNRLASRTPKVQPELKVSVPDIEQVDTLFQWSKPDGHTAYIDMLYTRPSSRGRGIATSLLRAVVPVMSALGATAVEAHIAMGNIGSVRAFQRAGWRVVETADKHYKASIEQLSVGNQC